MANFNALAGVNTLVTLKGRRKLDAFLTGRVGESALCTVIQKHLWLTDFIPEEEKQAWKASASKYLDIIAQYSNETVYDMMVPPKWKLIIEKQPGGKAWALAQLQIIRDFLNS